ncbi:MAG: response regulator [Acidobacteria bacterium]|nr:response regulator [Candidatus Atribacteria bacterium]MBE3125571.1 response regulator [Acidobacteriota bacterium]
MADLRWDIKRGVNVYHQVSDDRLKLWIKTGKIKTGEVVVWHGNFSGWRRPEELEELRPLFELCEKALSRKSERPGSARKPGPGKKQIKSILLIDDEKELCSLLGDSLSSRGFQMEFAHTKREALKCLKTRPQDLVLLDLSLPDGDGMALLALIRKTTPEPVVFITTAFGSEEVRSQAEKLGALDFIDKPYHEGDIIRRIRKIRIKGAKPGKRTVKTVAQKCR